MKRIVLLTLFILFYAISFSQETDTILYSDTECNESLSDSEMQNISIQFSNDTITISGDIIANCCGTHFMKYEIINDSISLTRIDTGDMCDCYCLHSININIVGCSLGSYKIHLSEYYGNNGFDTIVNNNPACVYYINDDIIEIYPNPIKESTTFFFKNSNSNSFTFYLFDTTGGLMETIEDINTDSFQFFRGNLKAGLYYFFLNDGAKVSYSGKLLII